MSAQGLQKTRDEGEGLQKTHAVTRLRADRTVVKTSTRTWSARRTEESKNAPIGVAPKIVQFSEPVWRRAGKSEAFQRAAW